MFSSLDFFFGGGYQIGKGFWFSDCHISEHFAVYFNPGSFKAVYQLTIFQTLGSAGGIYPQNPESSHIAFALAAVPVGIA